MSAVGKRDEADEIQILIELVERNGLDWLIRGAATACEVAADSADTEERAAELNGYVGMLNQIARKVGP